MLARYQIFDSSCFQLLPPATIAQSYGHALYRFRADVETKLDAAAEETKGVLVEGLSELCACACEAHYA